MIGDTQITVGGLLAAVAGVALLLLAGTIARWGEKNGYWVNGPGVE